ncbi:MAG: hypothetical protein ACI4DP_05395 [Candidatus Ornithomonoglobus sp.]
MEYSDLWLDYGTVDFEHSRIEQIYYDSKDRCVLNAVQELKMFCRAGGGDPSAEYRDNTDGSNHENSMV